MPRHLRGFSHIYGRNPVIPVNFLSPLPHRILSSNYCFVRLPPGVVLALADALPSSPQLLEYPWLHIVPVPPPRSGAEHSLPCCSGGEPTNPERQRGLRAGPHTPPLFVLQTSRQSEEVRYDAAQAPRSCTGPADRRRLVAGAAAGVCGPSPDGGTGRTNQVLFVATRTAASRRQ